MLRSLVENVLERRGFELKEIGAPVRGPENYIEWLRRDFTPGTVVDIGVATGTPWLYRFPDAKLVLVEPNNDFAEHLDRICREHDAELKPYGAGSVPGSLTLNVDLHAPSSSSLYRVSDELSTYWEKQGQTRPVEQKTIDIKTLDSMLGDAYPGPYLVKIDTEGFELEVLKGAVETLKKTECLIVETSVAKRHDNACTFAEVIAFLDTQNFRVNDVLDIQSFRDGGISYMDIAFTRSDTPAT